MTDLLARLKGVVLSGKGWTARCPTHDDQHNSLSIDHRDGRWLVKCHAGCSLQAITDALGITAADLFDRVGGGAPLQQPRNRATKGRIGEVRLALAGRCPGHHEATGLSLDDYARAKGCQSTSLGPSDCLSSHITAGPQCVFPISGRRRRSDGFVSGLKVIAFAGSREANPASLALIVSPMRERREWWFWLRGNPTAIPLWFRGIPALGIPGAANWREERDASHLEGIETIYVVIEPDRGGDAVRQWLSRSTIFHRVKLISLPAKDLSALHLEDPDAFPQQLQLACQGAVAWTAIEANANAEERTEAWAKCSGLAGKPNILDEFASDLSRIGVVGERRAAKLLYLALTSRLLDRPVAVAVKGPSSGGKSFIVESTLKFFPDTAFYALTAMSDRALAYSNEPLKHRHLVIYEAAGMASEFATYLIRSLLSEGRVRYETVEKTTEGLGPRLIEREGPTGLIVTTTSLRLHPENETRMLSLTITDTPDQTAAVFRALAQESNRAAIDLTRWHALQTWLAGGSNEVVIPFREEVGRAAASRRNQAAAGFQNGSDTDPGARLVASGITAKE